MVMNFYLERTRSALDRAIAGITTEELSREQAGKWCVAEILEHLSLTYDGTARVMQRCLDSGGTLASRTSARDLFARMHVTVLPGRYLARDAHGENPGAGYVRIALVPGIEDCVEAARRIVEFCDR